MNAPDSLVLFLHGAVSMASAIAGVLFLTYWRDSRDRFFVFFAVAFWVLGINWIVVAAVDPSAEHRHWFHAIRIVAFAFILIGIADKNRRRG